MSNAVFPSLPGLAWDVGKKPGFNTLTHRAVSGKEARASLMAYPLWTFKLAFEVLRDGLHGNDYDTLLGFILARYGAFDSFLYTDPTDYSVTDQQIGVGDGSETQFQLVRSLGYSFTFIEPVQNVNALTNIKVNDVVTAAYSINSTGLVTFDTAPPLGHTVKWTGTYYYRCRFLQDEHDFNQMLKDLWELRKLEFVGSTMNKV